MKNILHKALNTLFDKDSHLFEVDANERSISHRLAMYLQDLLPDWDVDCEYNRNYDDPKRLPIVACDDDSPLMDTAGTTAFPDIIVHKRNSSKNLLVLEMKKTTSSRSDEWDLKKLNGFIHGPLRYQYAVFLKVKAGEHGIGIEDLKWIKTGEHDQATESSETNLSTRETIKRSDVFKLVSFSVNQPEDEAIKTFPTIDKNIIHSLYELTDDQRCKLLSHCLFRDLLDPDEHREALRIGYDYFHWTDDPSGASAMWDIAVRLYEES